MVDRPLTTVVLAMTADGKIADFARSPARFSSQRDKFHLEQQISLVDGVLFGAETLRSYGTTLAISHPQLLQARKEQNKPLQPIHIVCSATGRINPKLPFFNQPIPRWLLTTSIGAQFWQKPSQIGFDRVLVTELLENSIDWRDAFLELSKLGLQKLAILGGGELVASLLAMDLIDELWLTICPLILGGATAPTPVEGKGWFADQAHRLELCQVERIDQEVFLHYRLRSRECGEIITNDKSSLYF